MSTTATIFIAITSIVILIMVAAIICILVMSGRSNQEQDESVLNNQDGVTTFLKENQNKLK